MNLLLSKKFLDLSSSTAFADDKFSPFPNNPLFPCVCSTNPLKTLWEEEKLLMMSNFSFETLSVFFPLGELSAISVKFEINICKLFQIWKSLKFVIWERDNLT